MKTTPGVVLLLMTLGVCIFAQQQTPVFRTAVDLVHLDVSVLDKDRKPVRGLTAADFTITEDNKSQSIVAFRPWMCLWIRRSRRSGARARRWTCSPTKARRIPKAACSCCCWTMR